MSVFYNHGILRDVTFASPKFKTDMNKKQLTEQAKVHLDVLCSEISERRVGSEGNRMASDYVKRIFEKSDWDIEETELLVMDWETEGATLCCGKESFEVFSSHYSLGCAVEGELLPVDTLEKLENVDMTGRILLLHGPIAAAQITPIGFPFYSVGEHERILYLLEKGNPSAIVTATGRDSLTAGGVYPFPMFEDGKFDIPSVYMKDSEGEKLLACAGKSVRLISKAKRIPETAYNVIGRKGSDPAKRIVISAHIDAKIGTPGAIDNATGVTVLLLLSEMLKGYSGKYMIELAAFNGEDYYAVPGQAKFLEQNEGQFGNIALNINIDGAGLKEGASCFSPFGLPDDMQKALNRIIADNPDIVEGLPWYQSDHSMFIQQGCPAIAVSSQFFIENMKTQDITHTPKDNLSIVGYERVVDCAVGIKELIEQL